MAQFKQNHSDKFAPMRYQIWSEIKVSGIHTSLDEPLTNSMFKRAGKKSSKTKESNLSEAITHAAVTLSSELTPKTIQRSCQSECKSCYEHRVKVKVVQTTK